MNRLIVALCVATMVILIGCGEGKPQLEMDASVPADLEAVAHDAWSAFLAAFPARHDCIGNATLVAAWELDDRAELDPETMTIVVRVPATAPQLTESMMHEFGHLLEFACPDQASVREPFRAAQGLAPDQEWFIADEWQDVPSEQWAEAVVRHVLGSQLANAGTVPVSAAAMDVVAEWANGP
jgi:hypothetical protein